jgi:sec-independent protein translocase protein TatA
MQISYTLANIFGGWGFVEFALLAVFGVLIFGRRLPEVGKNLGRSIVEFKKGLAGAGEGFVEGSTAEQPPRSQTIPAQTVSTALPSAVSPSTDEQLRKQQQEVERLSEELRQLRQQMAQKDAK